jgi:hypothetical protein
MVKSSQTPRSPRPATVSWDHVKFLTLVLLAASAIYVQQHLAWRQQQDWTDANRRDSVGWQALEGILMGFRGSPVSAPPVCLSIPPSLSLSHRS